jgi:type II secretory pathway pseudopilin PulG
MPRRRRIDADRGDTLLELIVAIAILGVCVVAIGAGITVSIKMSAIHRNQATASAFLHNYAETLQSSYPVCSGSMASDYASLVTAPSGFNLQTPTIKFWDPTSAKFLAVDTCPSPDSVLRQVGLTLVSQDTRVSESLVFVVRKTTP